MCGGEYNNSNSGAGDPPRGLKSLDKYERGG